MPVKETKLNVVICGAGVDVRLELLSLLEKFEGGHIVSNVATDNDNQETLVTAASDADLVIIAAEAEIGLATHIRKFMKIAWVSGVRNFALVVGNNGSGEVKSEFDDYLDYLSNEGGGTLAGKIVPAGGAALEDYLSSVASKIDPQSQTFRMPVEAVLDSAHPEGKLLSGTIATGDQVVILPAATRTTVKTISCNGNEVGQAHGGQTAKIVMAPGVPVAVGDMICPADNPVEVADQFEATIIWMSPVPLMAGRPYKIQSTANTVDASITTIKYSINVDSYEHVAANQLEQGEIGVCNISLARRVPFEPFDAGGKTSRFNVVDKNSGAIVGVGTIHFALRRASNVHWQALDVTREKRAQLKGQKPAILWFTGLSGSGKSAIANIVEKKLTALGKHTYTLDGDNIRHGLNRDLGFTDADRVENIRRIGEVARLMADSGLIVLVSFISPFRSERQLARELAQEGEFIEIHVDTPLEVAEKRDVKGLYKKARAGEIKNFTGIDSPYEAPQNPEIRVDTVKVSAEDAAENILEKLTARSMIISR